MILLTRYTVKIFLRNFTLALASFVGIYLLIDFFEKVDKFVEQSASPTLYFGYFLNAIPLFITQVAPLAVLMAAFISVGSLSRNGELTAMRAGGLSLYRITRPIIVTTLIVTLLLFLVQEFVLPASTSTMNRILQQEIKGNSQPQRVRNQVWVRTGNRILHIDKAFPARGALQGITVFELDQNFQISGRIDAGSARFENGEWLFRNLVRRHFDPVTGEMLKSERLSRQRFPFNKKPEDFKLTDPLEWELNFSDLRKLAKKMKTEGYDPTRYLVNMHAHVAAPFACLVMVLLGIPFALQRGRSSSLSFGIVVSVLIGVVYFILHSVAMAFGYSGILPPFLAAWSANILVGLTGLWLVLFRTQ